jgi:ABC-type transporter Mla maintaining outer membrane lipid asymmetry ATPase subunit MlaF
VSDPFVVIMNNKISLNQQPENCENRNDPDLVQAFLKMYKDKEVNKNVKNILLSMCDVKLFLTFASLGLVLL